MSLGPTGTPGFEIAAPGRSSGRRVDRQAEIERWAASGALALTGWPDGPLLGPPTGLIPRLDTLTATLSGQSGRLGTGVEVDPLALLTERAALTGARRGGTVSCGGTTRLLPATEGWVAVSLARDEDRELVPAWLGVDAVDAVDDMWDRLAAAIRTRSAPAVEARAVELGLAVAVASAPTRRSGVPAARATRIGDAAPVASLEGVVVADLSSLWAGPLCGSLLADAGASVIKVESTTRADGTRCGPPKVFDLLNAGKRSVAVDVADPAGRDLLRRLVESVDVVIEGSRPRALEQLGIHAETVLRHHRPRVWLSITGHGRDPANRTRIGFGDDAAAAGGLLCWHDARPAFCVDAIADPLTGLTGAVEVLGRLQEGGCWLVDLPLSRTAATFAGPTSPVPEVEAARPRAVRNRGSGPAPGQDTAIVVAEFGLTN